MFGAVKICLHTTTNNINLKCCLIIDITHNYEVDYPRYNRDCEQVYWKIRAQLFESVLYFRLESNKRSQGERRTK